MTGTSEGWVGSHFHRKEDHRLTTGQGAASSPTSRGRARSTWCSSGATTRTRSITSVDVSAAKAMPGVVAVVTGDDIKDEISAHAAAGGAAGAARELPQALAACGRQGEVARRAGGGGHRPRSPTSPQDAAEAIEVGYDPLPYVGDAESALAEGATIVHEGWADNVIFQMDFTGGADEESQRAHEAKVQEVFDSADIVIKQRFTCHRCGVAPMETRGALFEWDESDGLHRLAHHPASAHRQARALGHPRNPRREDPHHRAARPGRRLRREGTLLPRANADRLHGEEARNARSAGSRRGRST